MKWRLLVVAASLVLAIAGGLLGQRAEHGIAGLAVVAVIVAVVWLAIVLTSFGISSERRRKPSVGAVVLAVGLPLAAFVTCGLIGLADSARAFNECVEKGELVRHALADYKREHGSFPPSLDRLGMVGIPGRLTFGGSILQYRARDAAYSLSFADGVVDWSSSESAPFDAVK